MYIYQGTTRTEGIVLDISERPNHIDWKVFMQMENLKYLKIHNRRRYKSLDSRTQSNPDEILLPYKLRLLQWDAYPYTTLPSSINTDCLVEVILCNSKLTTLWSGSPTVCFPTKLILYMRFLNVFQHIPYVLFHQMSETFASEKAESYWIYVSKRTSRS